MFIKSQRRPLQQSKESPMVLSELVAMRQIKGGIIRLPTAMGPVVTELHSIGAGHIHGHASGQANP